MSCDRCGFTHYVERREDGTGNVKLGQTWWCMVNGQRIRLCLGCVAELRRGGDKVEVR